MEGRDTTVTSAFTEEHPQKETVHDLFPEGGVVNSFQKRQTSALHSQNHLQAVLGAGDRAQTPRRPGAGSWTRGGKGRTLALSAHTHVTLGQTGTAAQN